jgi:hypothetical protein
MNITDRRQHLLSTDRWRGLAAFVQRWYARPLSDADGHSPLEIEQVSRRLAVRFPTVVGEWFELVGRRLHDVQDLPIRLDDLEAIDGEVRIWSENQGVWSIFVPLDAGDDPICLVDGDDESHQGPSTPLSQTLFGMVVSDTLVGAWSEMQIGPSLGVLGELASSVRGGYCDNFTDKQVERLESAYPKLPHSINPTFEEPFRGDETTIIRCQQVAIEWMTSTDDAFASLSAILDLEPEGGE